MLRGRGQCFIQCVLEGVAGQVSSGGFAGRTCFPVGRGGKRQVGGVFRRVAGEQSGTQTLGSTALVAAYNTERLELEFFHVKVGHVPPTCIH